MISSGYLKHSGLFMQGYENRFSQAITRTFADRAVWLDGLNEKNEAEKADEMKRADRGGVNAIRPDQYLNIWVYLAEGIGGFATAYDVSAQPADGVVINTKAFGTVGYLKLTQQVGKRSARVGHWLGLYHIWEDPEGESCTDEMIS